MIFFHDGEVLGSLRGSEEKRMNIATVQGLEGARDKGFEKSNEQRSGAINYIAFST